jgi:hypothetical protein
MMSSVVWSAFYPITLPRRERSAVWHHPIMSTGGLGVVESLYCRALTARSSK